MFFIVSFGVIQGQFIIGHRKTQKSMLAEFVIKKVEHEKENSNSKPLPGKKM